MISGRLSSRREFTPVPSYGSVFVYMIRTQNVMPARVHPGSYVGPKGSITNQFTKTQINFPKHKSVYQNTKQFPKTQINFSKHKSVYQNTKQFLKTQISLPKHKTISQNTNQFTKTQINFSKHKPISSKHKSKDWALALLLSESLERRLQICCR